MARHQRTPPRKRYAAAPLHLRRTAPHLLSLTPRMSGTGRVAASIRERAAMRWVFEPESTSPNSGKRTRYASSRKRNVEPCSDFGFREAGYVTPHG